MLILLILLAAGWVAVIRVRRGTRLRAAAADGPAEPAPLPADDQPPASAVGWPPGGRHFTEYVDRGFAALDAYLSEGFAT